MARRVLAITDFRAEQVLLPARDAVREALRITVYGPNIPQRAVEPEILVGEARAQQVAVAPDQKSIHGFFLELPPEGAQITVRYGDSQEGVLRERFSRKRVQPLPKECE